jgi:hypothetical protein
VRACTRERGAMTTDVIWPGPDSTYFLFATFVSFVAE